MRPSSHSHYSQSDYHNTIAPSSSLYPQLNPKQTKASASESTKWDENEEKSRQTMLRSSLDQLLLGNNNGNEITAIVSLDNDDTTFQTSSYDDDDDVGEDAGSELEQIDRNDANIMIHHSHDKYFMTTKETAPAISHHHQYQIPFNRSASNITIDTTNSSSSSYNSSISAMPKPQSPPPIPISLNDKNDPIVSSYQIKSLQAHIIHLKNQNMSFQNISDQNKEKLRSMTLAYTDALQQLHLLQAHFKSQFNNENDGNIQPSEINYYNPQAQVQAASSQTSIQQRIQSLTCENSALETQIQSQQEESDKLNFVISDLRKLLEDQKEQNERTIHFKQNQIMVLQDQLVQKETELHECQKLLDNTQSEKEIVEKSLHQKQSDYIVEVDKLVASQKEIRVLLEERNSLRGQLDQYESNGFSALENQQQINQYTQEITFLQNDLKQKTDDFEHNISQLEEKYRERCKELEDSNQFLMNRKKEFVEVKRKLVSMVKFLSRIEEEEGIRNSNITEMVEQILLSDNTTLEDETKIEHDDENVDLLCDEDDDDDNLETLTKKLLLLNNKNRKPTTSVCTSTQTQTTHTISQGTNTIEDYASLQTMDNLLKEAETQIQLMEEENIALAEANKQLKEKQDLTIKQISQLRQQNFTNFLPEKRNKDSATTTTTTIQLTQLEQQNKTLIESKNSLQEENLRINKKHILLEKRFEKSISEVQSLEKQIEVYQSDMKTLGEQLKENQYQLETMKMKKESVEKEKDLLLIQLQQQKEKQLEYNIKEKESQIIIKKNVATETDTNIDMTPMHVSFGLNDTCYTALVSENDDNENDNNNTLLLSEESVPMEEWLEKWEYGMDQCMQESVESIANAVEFGLLLLINNTDGIVSSDKEYSTVSTPRTTVTKKIQEPDTHNLLHSHSPNNTNTSCLLLESTIQKSRNDLEISLSEARQETESKLEQIKQDINTLSYNYEEQRKSLLKDCNQVTDFKMLSLGNKMDLFSEQKYQKEKEDRDQCVLLACEELKHEYNKRIDSLLTEQKLELVRVS